MDQHPIPQDVTGFQFKLIGTMTVKQFGYVASGVILAVVTYYGLPNTQIGFILAKVLLIPLFGGSGAIIAFVPIEGRPVDVMATHFFKAVFSPNQYVYRKIGKKFSFSTLNLAAVAPNTEAIEAARKEQRTNPKQKELSKKEAQLHAYLESSHSSVKNALDQREQALLRSLALPVAPRTSLITATPQAVHTPAAAHPAPTKQPAPKPEQTKPEQNETLSQQETHLQQELQYAKQQETSTHTPTAHQKVQTLEQQLQTVHAQKQLLEQELLTLKSQLAAPQQLTAPAAQATTHVPTASAAPVQPNFLSVAPAPAPTQPQAAAIPASQYAKTISPTVPKNADLPHVSDTPNVVVGIVKDPRGNILPNMLVEVKDKDNNPVRAFKTNALGQFASATPLAPGIYRIELDDPKKQHKFDVIQITANNQIMLPIEIISHDAREALRKELFIN